MKKLILFVFAIAGVMYSFAAKTEDISQFRLKEYSTFEEYTEHYLNKVITYSPVEFNEWGSTRSKLIQQMNLGFNFKDFKVISITLEKKKKDYYVMNWLLKEENSYTHKSFSVYVGNYTKPLSREDDEYFFYELPFFDFTKCREVYKSEIGKKFSDPLVKAKYEVIDVYLDIRKIYPNSEPGIYKIYKLKNTITEKTVDYLASEAQHECFKEDKTGHYVSTLSKVEKPENPSIKYGKTTTIDEKGITKFSYNDNFINIIIFATSEQFNFTLKNVSQSTQKLIWDDAVFIDINGATSKVMHSGIKYSQREASQTPSTIIKGAILDDIACPISNVYYSESSKEWSTSSMYPSKISNKVYNVRLMLPIQIKDVTNEYIFTFDIKYNYDHPERLNL